MEFLVLSFTTLIEMREEIEAALQELDEDSGESTVISVLHYISEVFIG